MNKILALLLVLSLLLSGCVAGTAAEPVGANLIAAQDEAQVVIKGATGDSTYQVPRIDSDTRATISIEYEHFEIHHGHTYTILQVVDLGNSANRTLLVVSPDTTNWAHLVWEIEHELETSIQFYRDTTYSNNGTAVPSFNRNGNSTNTATTLVYHTPTAIDYGTSIGIIQQGDGKKAGGSDREANEFILKQNTAYSIIITNLSVDNNLIAIKLNWYEHINSVP